MENHAANVKIEAGLEHDRNITRQDISDALLAGPNRHNVCSPVPRLQPFAVLPAPLHRPLTTSRARRKLPR